MCFEARREERIRDVLHTRLWTSSVGAAAARATSRVATERKRIVPGVLLV